MAARIHHSGSAIEVFIGPSNLDVVVVARFLLDLSWLAGACGFREPGECKHKNSYVAKSCRQ